MTVDAEVIVVGGGPGGSAVAREIAAVGKRVMLLDREHFPRDKACGGGLSVKSVGLLPFDISHLVEHVATGVIVGDPIAGSATQEAGEAILFLTQRRRLDAFLLDQARAAGVDVREGQRVTHVQRREDGAFEITARLDDGSTDDGEVTVYTSYVVVGADGANGVVGRSLDFAPPAEYGVALEGNLPCPNGIPEWLRGRVLVSFAMLPGGYGWLFPKGDHVNVGVGGLEDAGPELRDELARFCTLFGWDIEALDDLRGHRLPLWGPGCRVASGGAALVGDAAGLVEALLGEGIYSALASAHLLAPVVARYLDGATGDLEAYQRALDRELAPSLQRAARIAAILHAWPRTLLRVMVRSRRIWWLMARVLDSGTGGHSGAVTTWLADAVLRPVVWLARRRGPKSGRA
ncbi:MAG: geranylgeranyl reductase family protein [Dehalococcoidia bacterium]|nr:geranylgeranyl reductase family protein [Dehalococcoidia bacterium]